MEYAGKSWRKRIAADTYRYRRGAPGGKLKMTLGLPVYVPLFILQLQRTINPLQHQHTQDERKKNH